MVQKIEIDDKEYDLEDLTEKAKLALKSMQFTNGRLQELNNMQALLMRAKNSYINSLKSEMLTNKGGLHFQDD